MRCLPLPSLPHWGLFAPPANGLQWVPSGTTDVHDDDDDDDDDDVDGDDDDDCCGGQMGSIWLH